MLRPSLLLGFCLAFIPNAFATPPNIFPRPGETVVFERNYDVNHLKNHPLQLVTKTRFKVSNDGGSYSGFWEATFRDIRTDETYEGSAYGMCRKVSARALECYFDSDAGMAVVSSSSASIFLTIPVGQGVRFEQETEDGPTTVEILLGTDDENRIFRLFPKRHR